MSLINEALKKAQRQRHENAPASALAGAESGAQIAKRAQPKSATSMLLIGIGAVVLVVASMVGTALWLTRPSKPEVSAPKVAQSTPVETHDAGPKVSLAAQVPPASTPRVAETPNPSRETSQPTPAAATKPPAVPKIETQPKATPPIEVAAAPGVSSPEPQVANAEIKPITPAPKPATPKTDERIHQFIESLKVAGIRSSGADSKVLMNDRVYRVNDYVDRSLGVRLTKVSSDSLTFTDDNGATYIKYF